MDRQSCEQLKSKSVKNAVVAQISEGFNLTPLLTVGEFNQIKGSFNEHSDISIESGQLHYLAIDDNDVRIARARAPRSRRRRPGKSPTWIQPAVSGRIKIINGGQKRRKLMLVYVRPLEGRFELSNNPNLELNT